MSSKPLPGSDRVYPSQDPRNQAPPGAPEAFPEPGTSSEGGGRADSAPRPDEAGFSGDQAQATISTRPGSPAAIGAEAASPAVYEVQLFASGSLQGARDKAMEIAERLQMPTRVIQDQGLHLVRVGEARDLAEAESLQRIAVDFGYHDARVVPR